MVSCFFHTFEAALALSRAILHDPVIYPEPDVFRPERFLDPDGNLRNDPILVSGFGYGKRICPGRQFAEATLFIVVASVLSVFDIERGPDSKDGPFNFSYTGATVRCVHHLFMGEERELILWFIAAPTHSHAVSFRGTNEQRSWSLQIPWRVRLAQLFFFFTRNFHRQCICRGNCPPAGDLRSHKDSLACFQQHWCWLAQWNELGLRK